MIPAAFAYQRPASLDEALDALAASDGSAKVLAGGQSLLPLLKLRLARPTTLIDIGRLRRAEGRPRQLADGGFEIGALTTYAEILDRPTQARLRPRLHPGHRRRPGPQPGHGRGGRSPTPTRRRTCRPCVLALDYEVVLRSKRGERVVPLDGFFEGAFATGIESDEILVSLRARATPGRREGSPTRSSSSRRRGTRSWVSARWSPRAAGASRTPASP